MFKKQNHWKIVKIKLRLDVRKSLALGLKLKNTFLSVAFLYLYSFWGALKNGTHKYKRTGRESNPYFKLMFLCRFYLSWSTLNLFCLKTLFKKTKLLLAFIIIPHHTLRYLPFDCFYWRRNNTLYRCCNFLCRSSLSQSQNNICLFS